jgi:hypothetical protein
MTDLLIRLLGTSGADAGCEGGQALLAEYVEAELEGRDLRVLMPTLAEHLANCPACAEDHEGVLALARAERS